MKKFVFGLLAIVLIVAVILTGCAPTAAPKPTWTLKMAFEMGPLQLATTGGHKPWAEDVARVTNGRVKVELFPSATLFQVKDSIDGIKSGLADVACFYGWIVPGQFDRLDVVQLPFMFTSAEAGGRSTWAVYNKFPEIQEQWKDVKVLAAWTTDPYVFITTKKQIKTMEDFNGMKMRMPGGVPSEMMKLLGGSPVALPMNATYENLQKGVIDGMAAPGEAILGFKHYEVAPNYTMVTSTPAHQELIMNKQVWESFPKDIQDAIWSVSGESQSIRYSRDGFDAAWKILPDTVKKAGFQMNTYTPPKAEVDKWKATVKPLYEKWVADQKAKGVANAQAMVDYCLEMAAKYNK